MSPFFLYSAFLFSVCLLANASTTNSTSEKKVESKPRSGRWNQENQLGANINAGEYASPSNPYYSVDSDENQERKDKSKYNVPTSFDEFVPDQRYGSSKGPSYKSGPPQSFGDYKGYSGDAESAPWMFPAEVLAVMNAIKNDEKDVGFLAKLKAEPIAVFLGIVLPLSLILAAVWPSILNFLMGGMMAPPPVTTTASGDNGGSGSTRNNRKADDPSFIVSILEAIEKFGENIISDMDKKADVKKEKKSP